MVHADPESGAPGAGPILRTEYDASGRRTASIDPAGNATRYAYDDAGRLTVTVFPDPEVAAHQGEVLWQSGSEQRAREIWLKALQEEPDNEPLRDTLRRFAPEVLPATP